MRGQILQLEKRCEKFKNVFSPRQLEKLENPNGRIRWTADDISNAVVHYSAGPRAYRVLLKKGYPFPAVSTIKSWVKKIKIQPGILKSVINVIQLKDMTKHQKVCVLSFDEIKIRRVYSYDKGNDETMQPYSYAQVVMIRGIFDNWKQPVYYNYDCRMTNDILFDIISYLENASNEY